MAICIWDSKRCISPIMCTSTVLNRCCCLLILVLVLHSQETKSTQDSSLELRRLQTAIFNQQWREYPEYGTYSGFHDYDDMLESYTLAAYKRRKDNCEDILRQANEIDETTLAREDRRELRTMKSYLQAYVDGYKWREYGALNPINFLEGLIKGPHWTVYSEFDEEADFQKYLKRLAAVPGQIDEQIGLMKKAIKLKRTSHRVSVDRVPEMLRKWPVEDIFFEPFNTGLKLSDISKDKRQKLWLKGKQSLPSIVNAFKRLQKFMDKEYAAATRPVEGVHFFAHGNQYYKACLKWYLGYDMSPEDIFDLGVKEVARIERQMTKIMESVGFHRNLKSFFQYVKYIPKFYNRTKEQLLSRYQRLIRKEIRPKLPYLFRNITIPPLTIVPVETDGPWGSYGQNVFYPNLKEPQKRSTFMMLPLALHEADPGHHFQDAYSQMYPIPEYRSESMNSKLYAVPFHFPVYSAYAEGWALYAEYLGEEMGLYNEPYDQFGRYCSEIFRACRLVVDTGIHAFGWSREQAIIFLSNYSDFPDSQIAAEVDRYITWPGQACAYKIGEIKFKELRRRAETALGRQFDVREFHHAVLKIGSVPLNILEDVVDDWIETKLPRNGPVTKATIVASSANYHDSVFLPMTSLTVILLHLR